MSKVGYLWQAGMGQLEISNRAKPISDVLKDPRLDSHTATLLQEISKIKKFAEDFGMKPTSNYVDYVDLKRPVAVWVVSACEKLDFKPKEWRFPIVGSFTYLGWFDSSKAQQFVSKLEQQGLDVDVRGARAFSTLGWFKDPVLSTMLSKDDSAVGSLVNVILHESVHATLYIKNQSYFNESLASFIADRLTPLYLAQKWGEHPSVVQAYLRRETEQQKAGHRIKQAYESLARLYASPASTEEKQSQKDSILRTLQKDLGTNRPLNNATLIQFKTYDTGYGEFEKLYSRCREDWARIWAALRTLTPASFSEPQDPNIGPMIVSLADRGCR